MVLQMLKFRCGCVRRDEEDGPARLSDLGEGVYEATIYVRPSPLLCPICRVLRQDELQILKDLEGKPPMDERRR